MTEWECRYCGYSVDFDTLTHIGRPKMDHRPLAVPMSSDNDERYEKERDAYRWLAGR